MFTKHDDNHDKLSCGKIHFGKTKINLGIVHKCGHFIMLDKRCFLYAYYIDCFVSYFRMTSFIDVLLSRISILCDLFLLVSKPHWYFNVVFLPYSNSPFSFTYGIDEKPNWTKGLTWKKEKENTLTLLLVNVTQCDKKFKMQPRFSRIAICFLLKSFNTHTIKKFLLLRIWTMVWYVLVIEVGLFGKYLLKYHWFPWRQVFYMKLFPLITNFVMNGKIYDQGNEPDVMRTNGMYFPNQRTLLTKTYYTSFISHTFWLLSS